MNDTSVPKPTTKHRVDDWSCPVCGSRDVGPLDDPDYKWHNPPETICHACGFADEDAAFEMTRVRRPRQR